MNTALPYAVLAVVTFTLHIFWERAHFHFYTGFGALEGVLPVYVLSALGDVMYTFLAVGFFSVVFGVPWREMSARHYGLFAVLGLVLAVFVEVKAGLLGRWEYTESMPLLFGLGLSPLLQMTVLLPLSVYITVRLEKWLNRDVV